MRTGAPPSARRPTNRLLRLILTTALGLAAIVVLGSVFLFAGSEVTCGELAEGDAGPGPGLLCRFDVAAPSAAVWAAFTDTGKPRPYYFDAVLEAEMRPGGRWRFLTDDRERLLADGEILALEPRHRFVHTFRAADLDDPPSRITVVLEEIPGGCRVTLTHDRFARKTKTYRRFRRAHPLALSALKSFLANGELPLRARLYTALFKPGMKTFTVRAEPWT